MTDKDPRAILDDSAMTIAQVVVVAITVLLNAMDGFDILSIAFAGPGISREWHINQLGLGIVLSMELIGMAAGSMLLGGLADKEGRRPALLKCLALMAAGMILATTASNPVQLSIWRVLTGLGIGGMLSCTNAVAAEFSNRKWRSLCISTMVIGYPLGGAVGGLYASSLISQYSWRSVFYFGAAATSVLLPIVFFLVPESIQWLSRKQPVDALDRVNRSLKHLGRGPIAALPKVQTEERKKTWLHLFSPAMTGTILIVTSAYFLHILTFYFLLKWEPKIAVDLGFTASAGGGVLTMANFGGAVGGIAFGLIASRVGLKPLTIGILALNAVAVAAFGRSPADLDRLTILAVVAGFLSNAAVSGLYSIAAHVFPTDMRATGTGFVIGIGRGGAVLSPWLVGYALQRGATLPTVGMIMGAGSLLAAGVLVFLKLDTSHAVGKRSDTISVLTARTDANSA